jgi:hypothetical protein
MRRKEYPLVEFKMQNPAFLVVRVLLDFQLRLVKRMVWLTILINSNPRSLVYLTPFFNQRTLCNQQGIGRSGAGRKA